MSLRHGARQLMDMFQADEDEARAEIALAISRLKYNPDYAIERLHKAQAALLRITERRTQELPEHIQKAAPPIEKELREIKRMVETQAARLDALEGDKVTKFRREA